MDGLSISPSLFSFSLSPSFLYRLSVMWGTSNHLLTDMSASRSFSGFFYSAAFVRPVTVATHCCPCFPLNRGEWISFRGLNRQSMSLPDIIRFNRRSSRCVLADPCDSSGIYYMASSGWSEQSTPIIIFPNDASHELWPFWCPLPVLPDHVFFSNTLSQNSNIICVIHFISFHKIIKISVELGIEVVITK